MSTEVWFRNPRLYVQQLSRWGEAKMVWLRGDLVNKRIEPVQWAKGYYGTTRDWRMLVVATTGAHEYDQTCANEAQPKACYPVWQYGESLEILELLAEQNCADDPLSWTDPTIDPFYRPRQGQEHRVVIMDLPPTTTGAGRRFLADVAEIQAKNPHCIIHLSGCWAYSVAFGFGAGSCDMDPHFEVSKNHMVLPNGKRINPDDGRDHEMWVNVLGYRISDDWDDRDHLLHFNVDSMNWAGEHYAENEKFRVSNNINKREFIPPQPTKTIFSKTGGKLPAMAVTDMVTCNTCSRMHTCKYFREDAVCSVPGANVTELAKVFRTRDSSTIIDGLGALVALEVDRIQEARENEVEDGRIDRNLTKAIDTAFSHGVDLAKLVDPMLRSPKLAVQINNGTQAPANLQSLAAEAVRSLEAQGIPRAQQTPEMLMKAIGAAPPVLEGRVVDGP